MKDFLGLSSFFCAAPYEFDAKASKKNWKPETNILMTEVINEQGKILDFTSENTENEIKDWITTKEIGFGKPICEVI